MKKKMKRILTKELEYSGIDDDSTSLLSFFNVSRNGESVIMKAEDSKEAAKSEIDDSTSLLSFFDAPMKKKKKRVEDSELRKLSSSNVDDDSASLLSFCDAPMMMKKKRVSGNGEVVMKVEFAGIEDLELRKLNSSNVDDSLSLCDVPMRRKKKRISGNGEVDLVEVTDCSTNSATAVSKKENEVEFAEIEVAKLRKLNSSIVDDSHSKRVSGNGGVVDFSRISSKESEMEKSMSKLNEGTSNYAGSTRMSMREKHSKFCDENDECEVESAVKSGITSLSKVNDGTSNHAGSTSLVVSMSSVMNKMTKMQRSGVGGRCRRCRRVGWRPAREEGGGGGGCPARNEGEGGGAEEERGGGRLKKGWELYF